MTKKVYRVEFYNFPDQEMEEVKSILIEKQPKDITEVPIILLDAGYVTICSLCLEEYSMNIFKIKKLER